MRKKYKIISLPINYLLNRFMSTNLELSTIWIIYLFSLTGILFAYFCTYKVFSIKPKPGNLNDEENQIEIDSLISLNQQNFIVTEKNVKDMECISTQISNGSDIFLFTEYMYLLVFVIMLGLLILFFGETKKWTFYTTLSFIFGAFTSMLCGFIGMKIAVNSNYRTTYSALYKIFNFF